jgi:hypothetical protein
VDGKDDYKYFSILHIIMETSKKLCKIVYHALPIEGFVREDSDAIERATEILVGISKDFVAESAIVEAGLNTPEEATASFKNKYFSAPQQARDWKKSSSSDGESYLVAQTLVVHLENAGDRYGLRKTFSNYHPI